VFNSHATIEATDEHGCSLHVPLFSLFSFISFALSLELELEETEGPMGELQLDN